MKMFEDVLTILEQKIFSLNSISNFQLSLLVNVEDFYIRGKLGVKNVTTLLLV